MQKITKIFVSVTTIFTVAFSPFTALTPTVEAAVGEITISNVENLGSNNFKIYGNWNPQGEQCWNPGGGGTFHYQIIIKDNDVPLPGVTVIPAACNGDYISPVSDDDKGQGGSWPATGQGDLIFTLTSGVHTICADLIHVNPAGQDIGRTSACWDHSIILGCTDHEASNYNSAATDDDGSCIYSNCGDGILDGRETCDDGTFNGTPNHCNADCTGQTTPICGNNIIESGEQCDDGGIADDDGCSATCQLEQNPPTCGDGTCNGAETCETCEIDCGTCCDYVCFTPDSLGDIQSEAINSINSGETTLQQLLTSAGYAVDVDNDQTNIQVWNTNDTAELEITYLGGIAGHSHVFGYYLNSDPNTFVGIFERNNHPLYDLPIANIGDKFTVTINSGETVGFAIDDYGVASNKYFSENSLNSDIDRVVVFDFCDEFVLGFNDLYNDLDYQDIIVGVEKISCGEQPECNPFSLDWTELDRADIGTQISEFYHPINGWTDANLPGNYGGCQQGAVCSYRQIIEPPCTGEEKEATVVLYAGSNTVSNLVVRHLDGISLLDSFDVYVNDVKAGSFSDVTQIQTEEWKTTEFDVSGLNFSGDIIVKFVATDNIWTQCPTYGQVSIDWVAIEGCGEPWNPFCGNGILEGSEECEENGDCGCGENCVNCICKQKPEESVTIKAYKVVCQSENDLPNWGDGGSDITEITAQDFVNGNQNCHFEEGWDFEWAYAGTANPGDNIIGLAGGNWNNFGPTDNDGLAVTNINSLNGDRIWVREVMKEGYIPFSGDTTAPRDNISAELYCHQDVLNYDNYDYVESPQFGEIYYCVGFNVPLQEPIPGCTDPAALNYNPDATVDDGSCEYPPEPIPGCTNPTALNYNPAATVDDGSCLYPGGFCGDLAVNQSWEQCDDGNNANGDGCTSDCRTESQPPVDPYCGDGIVNGNEECDGLAGVAEGQICNASCVLGASTCNLDLDVMMIMDVSGSMGYENPSKLSQAKTAANSFLDYLRNGDQSGLVSFGTNASLKKTLSNDHAGTQLIINGLTAYGATNIGEAIDIANKAFLSAEHNPDALKIATLLTDGMANQPNGNGSGENSQDIALVILKSLEAAAGGIKMFVIGLGTGVNETMLKNVAANTGGNYYFAPTANDLNDVFNQIAFDNCVIEPPASEISIFNVRILSVSADSAIVSWYTNIPATSRVVYDSQPVSAIGGEPNYGYVFSTPEQDSVNKVIFHSVTITDLVPGTTYFWRPISHGSPIKVGDELSFTTSISEESDVESCVGEGESIPVIASLPACCAGLEMIPPKEEQIVGIFGICTANCGNGICNEETESYLNCSEDCEMAGEIGAEGAENIAGAMAEQSDLVKLLAASGRFINDRWLILVVIAAVLLILYWMIFGRKRKNKNTI